MSKFKNFILYCLAFLFSRSPLAGSEVKIGATNLASYMVKTSQGQIAVWDSKPMSGAGYPTIIFLHGHCANKIFFSQQMASPLLAKYRLICLDLPGYGESTPPIDPEKTYSFPGFADAVAEVVDLLKLQNIAVVGWSLGGHVGLELTSKLDQLKGLLITGAPPIEISAEGLSRGFRIPNPKILECFGKGNLTEEEAELMATISGYDYSKEKRFIVEAIFQTSEGAKTIYPQSILKGIGQNELDIVRNWPRPIAVIAGENDAAINTDYILHEVNFRNLWRNKVHVIANAGHAVQMEQPNEFNKLLEEFSQDVFKN
jgi:pimeloyl-ACP methyl ester carboxylesterase